MKSAKTGGEATLLARSPQGFVRTSTTIKLKEGDRATGTSIPDQSPISEALLKKERYFGRENIQGKWYTVVYAPLIKNSEITGAFSLALLETSSNRIK